MNSTHMNLEFSFCFEIFLARLAWIDPCFSFIHMNRSKMLDHIFHMGMDEVFHVLQQYGELNCFSIYSNNHINHTWIQTYSERYRIPWCIFFTSWNKEFELSRSFCYIRNGSKWVGLKWRHDYVYSTCKTMGENDKKKSFSVDIWLLNNFFHFKKIKKRLISNNLRSFCDFF